MTSYIIIVLLSVEGDAEDFGVTGTYVACKMIPEAWLCRHIPALFSLLVCVHVYVYGYMGIRMWRAEIKQCVLLFGDHPLNWLRQDPSLASEAH